MDANRLEPREVAAQRVAVARWKRPRVEQERQALPRQGHFHGPPAVRRRRIVDAPVDSHRRLKSREVEVEEREPAATRVPAPSAGVLEPAEHVHVARVQIEFGDVEPAAARHGVLPDEERLVDRAERVDLEFVVAVVAADEDLDVVVVPDEAVALGQRRTHLRFLHPVGHVEAIVVPLAGHARVVERGLAAHHVDEARRPHGVLPRRLRQVPVDHDRLHRARAGDLHQPILRHPVTCGHGGYFSSTSMTRIGLSPGFTGSCVTPASR